MCTVIKEYGSEFDWESTLPYVSNTYIEHPLKNEAAYLFRSGRDSLKAVAAGYSETHKKALLPALCCESMVSPFSMNGYDVNFYKLNGDCTADIADIANKLSDDCVFLYMSYFGVKPLSDESLSSLKEKFSKAKFVEDRTHNPLHRVGEGGFSADAMVISIRKWLSIADGGLLFTNDCFDNSYLSENNFADIRKNAMELKSEYLKTGDEELKSQFRGLLNEASELLDASKNAYIMTEDSKQLLNKVDFDKILKDRQRNAKILAENLAHLCENGKLKFISQEPENSTIYFPVIVADRDAVQGQLAKKSVFCPVIWPLPEGAEGVCENSQYIADNMLAVPCDQRYSEEDMLIIAKAINEVLI